MAKILFILSFTLFPFLKGISQAPNAGYCSDSSFRKYFYIPNDSIEAIGKMDGFSGGQLILGRHKTAASTLEDGLVFSLDSIARIVWSKDYTDNTPNEQFRLIRGIKLISNEYLVAGRITSPSNALLNKFVLSKLDNQGAVIWSKVLQIDPAIDNDAVFQVQGMCEGFNGEVIVSGTVYGDLNNGYSGQYGFIIKISGTGNPVFSKLFILDPGTINDLSGVFLKGNLIMVFGTVEDGTCQSLDPRAMYSMSLDYSDGSIKDVHRYCYPQAAGVIGFARYLHNYEGSETNSGYSFYGFLGESGTGARDFLIANFDSDGLFVNGLTITDHFLGKSFHNLTVNKTGNVFIMGVSPTQGLYSSIFSGNGKLISQTKADLQNFDRLYFSYEGGDKLSVRENGFANYINNAVADNNNSITLINKFYGNDFRSECLGSDTSYSTAVNDLVLTPSSLRIKKIVSGGISLMDINLSVRDNMLQSTDVCNQASHCSGLYIEGRDTICAAGSFSVYKGVKNAACFQRIQWQYDSSWMDHWQMKNDSTVDIYPKDGLKTPNSYSLKLSLNGCQEIDSTRQITILTGGTKAIQGVNLCVGDSLILSPGGYFDSYHWQDGSEDSFLVVKYGGIYSVRADFNGCSILDTFKVNPFHDSPKLFLGADTSICQNADLVLHAGPGFKTYKWQDNSTDSVYKVTAAGAYYLSVTNTCDVESSDTIRVVFTNSCLPFFRIPNAFTPNGDGINETYRPIILGNIQRYEFGIYNRSGMLVFHSNKPGEGWNGNISGVLQPPDGYLWYCKYYIGDKAYFQKGSLILLE